jgi:hypothetical protein
MQVRKHPFAVGLVTACIVAASTVALAGAAPSARASEATAALPYGALRQVGTVTGAPSEYQGGNWANPDPVYEYTTDEDQVLVIVKHDPNANRLTIDHYDDWTRQPIGSQQVVSLAGWPDWGGFLSGDDGFSYVLVGRENPDQNDNLPVVAVRRYDPSWNLVGTAYVDGRATQGIKGIYSPFVAGAPHMTLTSGRLVVHMSRLAYAIDGVHHQANLTFQIDTSTMAATPFERLGQYAYSSHSFQQLVSMDGDEADGHGNDLVMIDHGDAYPRAIQMGVMTDYPARREVATYNLFGFNGAIGNNFTGASVTDMVTGPRDVLVLGNSIPQPNAPNGPLGNDSEHRNVFAISADPATGRHTVHWLTHFAEHGQDSAGEPRAVELSPDRYAVLFDVHNGSFHKLEYRLMTSSGTVLASRTFPGAFFSSSSAPLVLGTGPAGGSTLMWVGIPPGGYRTTAAYLYGLFLDNPRTPVLAGASTPRATQRTDFTGSGTADIAVYRPATHQWFVRDVKVVTYGADGDLPEPGDYNGDGRSDIAVYRPSTHRWYVRGGPSVVYGADGDIPEPADYNGDGHTDIAVYRPATSQWFIRGMGAVTYGADGDVPVPADYNGDRHADIAVYRPSQHRWYIRGGPAVVYGADGDVVVPADYNGDGHADIAVYRPDSGRPPCTWYVRGDVGVTFGNTAVLPVPADYDGDGRADIAVYDPSRHSWDIRAVGEQREFVYGAEGDIPL